jgi:hypothetical protein
MVAEPRVGLMGAEPGVKLRLGFVEAVATMRSFRCRKVPRRVG